VWTAEHSLNVAALIASVAALSHPLSRWLDRFFVGLYLGPISPTWRRPVASCGARSEIPQAKRVEPFLGPRGPWP
jgi:hypothetical protein